MVDFNSVLSDARQLSEEDQLRLINALAIGDQTNNAAADEAWNQTLQRRIAEVRSSTVELIPWETIRDESLRRIEANKVD